nr:lysylphosphatidylglycerol synthase transmembrane domain-containing protein [Anaerolinea sp.]
MSDLPPVRATKSRPIPLWRIGGTLLSLGLLVYLVYQQGWGEFSAALRQLSLGYFGLALGLIICSRMFVTLRWYVLLRSAGVEINFWRATSLVFMGLFASNFLPSTVGGDFVRMAGTVYLRLDAGVSAASLLVDRLVGMAGMALMLPAGLATVLGAGGTAASGGLLALPKLQPL